MLFAFPSESVFAFAGIPRYDPKRKYKPNEHNRRVRQKKHSTPAKARMTPQLVIPLGEAQLDLQEHFAAGQALFEKQIGSWEEFHSTEDAFTRWDEDSRNLLHSFTEDDSLIDVYDNVSFAAGMLGRDLVLIEEIASLRKNISERLEQFDEIRKGLPRLPQAGNGA